MREVLFEHTGWALARIMENQIVIMKALERNLVQPDKPGSIMETRNDLIMAIELTTRPSE